MLRWLLIVFLIAHGLVPVAIRTRKYDPEKAAFDASHSWLIGDQRVLAQVLAFTAAALLVLAGIALWAHGGWWRPTAVVGLSVSTVLLLPYFNPWDPDGINTGEVPAGEPSSGQGHGDRRRRSRWHRMGPSQGLTREARPSLRGGGYGPETRAPQGERPPAEGGNRADGHT